MNDKFHYIRCVICGERLCVETDSYRYTADDAPLCYECAERFGELD